MFFSDCLNWTRAYALVSFEQIVQFTQTLFQLKGYTHISWADLDIIMPGRRGFDCQVKRRIGMQKMTIIYHNFRIRTWRSKSIGEPFSTTCNSWLHGKCTTRIADRQRNARQRRIVAPIAAWSRRRSPRTYIGREYWAKKVMAPGTHEITLTHTKFLNLGTNFWATCLIKDRSQAMLRIAKILKWNLKKWPRLR